jgi:hypothetical protein
MLISEKSFVFVFLIYSIEKRRKIFDTEKEKGNMDLNLFEAVEEASAVWF